MHSTLHPPNTECLSDTIIGTVVLRDKPASCAEEVVGSTINDDNARIRAAPAFLSSVPALTMSRVQREKVAATNHADSLPHIFMCSSAIPSRTHNPSSEFFKSNESQDDKVDPKQLHRERRRMTQIRYRKKLRDRGSTLEKNVWRLREEVRKLELQCRTISPRILENVTPINVTAEWFRLFRYGMNTYVPPSQRCNSLATSGPYESIVQRDFLHATMAEDVVVQSGRGVDAFLQEWRMISMMHEEIDLRLVRLEYGPGHTIVATSADRVSVTTDTLRYTFPHLLSENNEEAQHLSAKLLGREFTMYGSISLQWDPPTGKVTSFQHTADMLTPMLKILGNLEDVSRLFGSASITPDCSLVQ